jgi:uncharacterized protein YaiI (UPF0178 family)
MTIYVDADACPVKDQIYRVAARDGIEVVVVANSFMRVPSRPYISLVVVEGGLDVADDWIAAAAGDGDVVTTADIPLASRALACGAVAIDFRGKEFTADSIGGLLASRDLAQQLRMAGAVTRGPSPLSRRERGLFAGKLDEVLNRLRLRAAARATDDSLADAH